METAITVVGNATSEPQLRFTATGTAVASFTVASTARQYDKATNAWRDADTLFVRVNAWRSMAENAADSLRKGVRVIVTGRLRQTTWTADDGAQRTGLEIDADDIGVSLRWATAHINRTVRHLSGPQPDGADPWAATPAGPADAGAPF
jgi:single-strand DNA-binding protein